MIRMAPGPRACDYKGVPVPRILRSASDGAERLLDRILCVLGAILFSQAPEFMQQYLQRLEGHLDEARLALGRLRDAAAQAGMTIDQLVSGAGQNPDPSMRALGGMVRGSVARVTELSLADDALRHATALTGRSCSWPTSTGASRGRRHPSTGPRCRRRPRASRMPRSGSSSSSPPTTWRCGRRSPPISVGRPRRPPPRRAGKPPANPWTARRRRPTCGGAMPEKLQVRLGDRSYPILFGGSLAAAVRSKAAELARGRRRVAVITDRTVARVHAAALRRMFGRAPVLILPPGETSKSIAMLGRALDFLAAAAWTARAPSSPSGAASSATSPALPRRRTCAGWTSTRCRRPCSPWWTARSGERPGSTLPRARTLPAPSTSRAVCTSRQGSWRRSRAASSRRGTAEVVKSALLADPRLFGELERAPLTASDRRLSGIVRRCCAIKAALVEADEEERATQGGRALLNLGHTLATRSSR